MNNMSSTHMPSAMPPKSPKLHVQAERRKRSNDANDINIPLPLMPSMYQGATLAEAAAPQPPPFARGAKQQHQQEEEEDQCRRLYIQSDNRNTPPKKFQLHHEQDFRNYHIPGATLKGASTVELEELAKLEVSSTGRKGDNRMNRAVAAKKNFPDISLEQALAIGGFKFPSSNGSLTDKEIFDEDNRSLSQRKNQLNRRLRYGHKDKKRCSRPSPSRTTKKRDRGNSEDVYSTCSFNGNYYYDDECSSDSSRSITSLPNDVTTSNKSECVYKADKDPSSFSVSPCLSSQRDGTNPMPPTRPPASKRRSIERRDSFLDQIMEIPDIDELPDSFAS